MPGKRKEKKRLRQEDEKGIFDDHELPQQPEPRRITPVDIQQKEFRLAMRGYHERDVDEFLDELTEEVARLYAENKRLREELDSKGTGRFAPGASSGEAEAALLQAREEAGRIIEEAESRARMIGAAAGPGQGGGGTPAVTGAALAGFLSREKSFLQGLAKMMQEHANAMKEDVRKVRMSATADRASGPSKEEPVSAPLAPPPTADSPEPRRTREPQAGHDLWRPPPEEGSVPSSSASSEASPPARTGQESPSGVEPDRSDQPPYFMDERPQGQPVIDLMDVEERPQVLQDERLQVIETEPPSVPSFEPQAGLAFQAEAPPAPTFPGGSGSSNETDPHVDEPTGEWTYGEGGIDIRDAEELAARREGAAPGTRSPRWAPHPEEEAPGDDRSLKELFWGED